MSRSKVLRDLIRAEATLVMPDAYDPISARTIEAAGFPAVQCSGYSISLARGYSSEEDVSRDENLEVTRQIAAAVAVRAPLSVAAGLPYNIDHFSIDDLAGAGVARVGLPCLAVFAAAHGMQRVLRELAASGDLARLKPMLTHPEEVSI